MKLEKLLPLKVYLQWNFSGSNTDGSLPMAILDSFLSPFEKSHSCRLRIINGDFFLFFILKMVYCVYMYLLESP